MENHSFLKKKYDLHNAPEVKQQAERTEARSGEKVPQDPSARIQNYLDRFKEITDRKDPAERERGLEALKRILYRNNVIKPEQVPESAFLLEQRIARELGHGDVEITEEFKEKKIEQIINDQKTSLDKWIDYLSSPDAQYADWGKYWIIRSVLETGKLQKEMDAQGHETAVFKKRTKDTVASFPPLNPGALAKTLSSLKSLLAENAKPKQEQKMIVNESARLTDQELKKLVATENFSKIYAQFLIEMPEYSTKGLQETRGKWITFPQGSDAAPLVNSLAGHPLEWCIRDFSTAQNYLQGGNFYLYYSLDQNGQPIIPRAAIRMEANTIAEVRGIAPDQNLDPYIAPVVQKKMHEFPDGQAYEKKAGDMKLLTTIENKTKNNQPLSKQELVFLYEIDILIEGFGYQKDPRIKELRDQRDLKEDAPIVFECSPNQIAWNKEEINQNTKAYVGPLFKDIFKKLNHLEHIYTSFPEGKIHRQTIEIGGKTAEQLEEEISKAGMKINDYAKFMMKSKEFKLQIKSEKIDTVRLKVKDLFGDNQNHTTEEIYKKAEEFILELCPPEVGPHYRLAYKDQPMGEWFYIAMNQIADPVRSPDVFGLGRGSDGVWRGYRWAVPGFRWGPGDEIVFRLPGLRK